MAKPRVLYIEWDDHCSSSNNWTSKKSFELHNHGMRCKSIGIVIAESKDAITLCGTWSDDGDAKSDQTILKNCIRKKRRVVI